MAHDSVHGSCLQHSGMEERISATHDLVERLGRKVDRMTWAVTGALFSVLLATAAALLKGCV